MQTTKQKGRIPAQDATPANVNNNTSSDIIVIAILTAGDEVEIRLRPGDKFEMRPIGPCKIQIHRPDFEPPSVNEPDGSGHTKVVIH